MYVQQAGVTGMRHKILIALAKIVVESNFKTVKEKFLKEGIDVAFVDQYLKDFKKLRDENKIKDNKQKDIDFWGTSSFDTFVEFVDNTKQQKSKTEKTKIEKAEGAELVAENDDWLIYRITNHQACRRYGYGTRWCITEEDGSRWREYSRANTFYFLLAKNIGPEDPMYKIAAQVNNRTNNITFWNAEDRTIRITTDEFKKLNIPECKLEAFESPVIKNLIKNIREGGLTDDVLEAIEELCGEQPLDYMEDHDFLVFEKYKDLDELKKYLPQNSSLAWNLSILDGDTFLEPDAPLLDSREIDDILKAVRERDNDLFNKFIVKLLAYGEFKDFLKREYDLVEIDTLEKYNAAFKDPIEAIEPFITQGDNGDEVTQIFSFAASDAMRSETESMLFREVDRGLRDCSVISYEGDHIFDTPIYIGIPLNEINTTDLEYTNNIKEYLYEEINKIGLDKFDYVYPSTETIVEHLIEYQLSEYCH